MTPRQTICWPALLLLAAPPPLIVSADRAEPTYQGKPLSRWLEQLRGDNRKDRQESAVALEKNIGPAGKAAVGALIEALEDNDEVVRSRAAGALGKIGPAARARPSPLWKTP
jgi:hypothetical protein